MYSLASAGLSVKQIQAAVGPVLLFAGAAATSLGDAAEQTAQALRMFGLEADKTEEVVNVFTAGIQNSSLTASRLKESMSEVGTVASSLGLDIQETVAHLGSLHNAGMVGGIAGTRLKNVFVQLAKPNQVLKGLLGDVSMETHGLSGVMDRLNKVGANAGQIFSAFGLRAGPAVLAFMKQGGAAMDEMIGKVTGTSAATEAYRKQMDTVASQFKIFKSGMEESMIATFEALKPEIRSALQGMISWVNESRPVIVGMIKNVTAWVKANADTIKTILKIVAIGGALVATVMLIALAVGKIVAVVKVTYAVLKILRAAWILAHAAGLGPWGLLALAIAIVVGLIIKFRKQILKATEGLRESFMKAVNKVKEFIFDLFNTIGGLLSKFLPGWDEFVAYVEKGAAEAVSSVQWVASGVEGAVTASVDAIQGKIADALAGLKKLGAEGLPQLEMETTTKISKISISPTHIGPGGMSTLGMPSVEDVTSYYEMVAATHEIAVMKQAQLGDLHLKETLDARLEWIDIVYQSEMDQAGHTAQEVAQLEIDKAAEIAEKKMDYQDAVHDHWMATHNSQLNALSILESGYDTFFANILDKEMTGKARREAIWKSMKKTYIKNTAEMGKAFIAQTLKNLLIARTAEEQSFLRTKYEGAKLGAVRAYSAFASIPVVGPVLGAAAAAAAFAFLMAFHQGGMIPGFGKDNTPIMAQSGEFMVRRSSVASVGVDNMEYINNTGRLPATQATGTSGITLVFPIDQGSGVNIDEFREEADEVLVPVVEDLYRRHRLKLEKKVRR
jgi:TP901 family phage tail tape measure protein